MRRSGWRIGLLPWVAAAAALTAGAPVHAQQGERSPEGFSAPVELDGVVLFHVRGVSSFPAEARAGSIRDRIVALAADPAVTIESLRIVDGSDASTILAGDRAILAIVEADAALEQVSAAELARGHLIRLQQAITDYRAARTAAALRRAALETLAATAGLLAAAAALLWAWRRLNRALKRRLEARIHSVGIQSFEVVRADRIWAAVQSVLLGLRTLSLGALLLVYFGLVLAQWPWTRGLSGGLASFTLGPLSVMGRGLVAEIPSLVFLTVLYLVIRVGLGIMRLFFEAVRDGTVTLAGFDAEWAQPTYKIVRLAVVAFGVIVAYPYIPGSESAAFKGVSLFIGIIFSLGSSSAISNIIAGYMMTYRRAFRVGDRVKIGDAVGDVIEMRLQVTHLRSYKNEELVIPNSLILGDQVMNYSSLSREHGLILHTEVGIGYETPWRQVEAMLIAAAGRTPGIGRDPAPFVLLKRLGDFAVTYELNACCREVRAMNELYTALHRNILDVFNEYGVQIMTPAYEGDPAEPKIVPRNAWFAAPAIPSAEAVPGTTALVAERR
jgi:small-conductance mechanosensitive channel